MKKFQLGILVLYSLSALSQESDFSAFDNLVGSTWISEGKQLGGHDGKTVKEFEWGLEGKIVKVKTYTTDPETLEFGLRNEGVRFLNVETDRIEFYEFDKQGRVSQGVVKTDGKSLHYEYAYGELTLRDSWIFVSEEEYQFRVCSVESDTCSQVYHEGRFKKK